MKGIKLTSFITLLAGMVQIGRHMIIAVHLDGHTTNNWVADIFSVTWLVFAVMFGIVEGLLFMQATKAIARASEDVKKRINIWLYLALATIFVSSVPPLAGESLNMTAAAWLLSNQWLVGLWAGTAVASNAFVLIASGAVETVIDKWDVVKEKRAATNIGCDQKPALATQKKSLQITNEGRDAEIARIAEELQSSGEKVTSTKIADKLGITGAAVRQTNGYKELQDRGIASRRLANRSSES